MKVKFKEAFKVKEDGSLDFEHMTPDEQKKFKEELAAWRKTVKIPEKDRLNENLLTDWRAIPDTYDPETLFTENLKHRPPVTLKEYTRWDPDKAFSKNKFQEFYGDYDEDFYDDEDEEELSPEEMGYFKYLLDKERVAGLDKEERYELQDFINRYGYPEEEDEEYLDSLDFVDEDEPIEDSFYEDDFERDDDFYPNENECESCEIDDSGVVYPEDFDYDNSRRASKRVEKVSRKREASRYNSAEVLMYFETREDRDKAFSIFLDHGEDVYKCDAHYTPAFPGSEGKGAIDRALVIYADLYGSYSTAKKDLPIKSNNGTDTVVPTKQLKQAAMDEEVKEFVEDMESLLPVKVVEFEYNGILEESLQEKSIYSKKNDIACYVIKDSETGKYFVEDGNTGDYKDDCWWSDNYEDAKAYDDPEEAECDSSDIAADFSWDSEDEEKYSESILELKKNRFLVLPVYPTGLEPSNKEITENPYLKEY